ncbi:MAG: phage tail protein, partial [Symploca sp. SIO2E6]|nr:phage tail protein [Symploca sp. SIO2E6]
GLDVLLPQEANNRVYGVTVGVVTNNKDPDGLGRVKVKFPWLSTQDESYWARIATLMAGDKRGAYFIPEVDDEVLVAFEQGDMAFPYILGGLWNGKDKPPETNKDGKNNLRLIKSRSGHQIILDDTKGEEKIIIEDKTGKNKITIDSKKNDMTIEVENDLTIKAKKKINIESAEDDISIKCKNLTIKTQEDLQIDAGKDCTIKAKAKGEIESSSGMTIKCSAGVKVNNGNLEVM